jgi:hypothetical protein
MSKSKHRSKNRTRPKPIKWRGDENLFEVPANPRPTVEFPRPETNSKIEFTLVPGFPPDHPQAKIPRSQFGGKSVYRVQYFLSIPGVNVFKDWVDLEKVKGTGDSLLQLPIGEHLIAKVQKDNTELEIQFLGNKKGVLSQVLLRVDCNSFEEAERFAHERVSVMLSYWSFLFDIGIDMSDYLIVEEKTGTLKYSIGLIGKMKAFDNDLAFSNLPKEYQRVLAAYREAMNSSNLFYQLLCFFKVTEGVVTLRQKEIKKTRPLRKGEQGFETDEKFPTDISSLAITDEISKAAFTDYLGKGFQEVREFLKDEFRHAIAHLIKFDNVLDADRFDDVTKCARAIPIIKYIARKMLERNISKFQEINN